MKCSMRGWIQTGEINWISPLFGGRVALGHSGVPQTFANNAINLAARMARNTWKEKHCHHTNHRSNKSVYDLVHIDVDFNCEYNQAICVRVHARNGSDRYYYRIYGYLGLGRPTFGPKVKTLTRALHTLSLDAVHVLKFGARLENHLRSKTMMPLPCTMMQHKVSAISIIIILSVRIAHSSTATVVVDAAPAHNLTQLFHPPTHTESKCWKQPTRTALLLLFTF